MPKNLTETAISSAKKEAKENKKRIELVDSVQVGLRLRVTSRSQSWVLACRDTLGRMRRFPLGDYPAIGISDARRGAREMRVNVTKGQDPVADARRKRAIGRDAREGIGTLTALLDDYAEKQGFRLKSWPECRRRIDHVFASLLSKPMVTLTRKDLQQVADNHPRQQSAAAAVRYIRPILKWGAHRDRAATELTTLQPPATVNHRRRVLSRDELRALLPVLAQSSRPYEAALQFMLLTLARREEVGQARWKDLDFNACTWTLRETKNGEPHVVPLSRQALALLEAVCPVDARAPNAIIFATKNGKPLGNWDRETKRIKDEVKKREREEADDCTANARAEAVSDEKLPPWTRHDLRRTGATMLGEMGVPPHVVEAALNHVAIHSSLAAGYNLARYRGEVADALQRLADALDRIAIEGDNVVNLAEARKAAGVAGS